MGFAAREKWKTPLLFFLQILFILQQGAFSKKNIIMVQFAGYHSFVPCLWAKIFGLKSIIIVGGTDCVSFPSLGYGHFHKKMLARFTRWSYQLCNVVSAVHESLFYREDHYYLEKESKQGILHFFPKARFRKNVIFNGFDTELFRIINPWDSRREGSYLSISASLTDSVRMKLKGIDMVLELAATMPEASFTLIGSSGNVPEKLPANVQLLPYVPNKELPKLYNQHRYYLQLSISEGFPNALCEAMACGCIPIVSAVASMPEITGQSGGIAQKRNLKEILEAAEDAKKKSFTPDWAESVSKRVTENYSWEKRQKGLLHLIEEIAESS
jgi:glycosyltransferase involved in cell wall biosynthesis